MKYEDQDPTAPKIFVDPETLVNPLGPLGVKAPEEALKAPKDLGSPNVPPLPGPKDLHHELIEAGVIGPKDIQSLVAQTGQYLMDVGYIMRRAPDTFMDNVELDAVAHALQVVIGHMTTVRERLVALGLVGAMDSEGSGGPEDPGDPGDPEDPEDSGDSGDPGYEDCWDPDGYGYEDCWDPGDPGDPEDPEDSGDPEDPHVPKSAHGGAQGAGHGKSDFLGADPRKAMVTVALPEHQDEAHIEGCMSELDFTREDAITYLKIGDIFNGK